MTHQDLNHWRPQIHSLTNEHMRNHLEDVAALAVFEALPGAGAPAVYGAPPDAEALLVASVAPVASTALVASVAPVASSALVASFSPPLPFSFSTSPAASTFLALAAFS